MTDHLSQSERSGSERESAFGRHLWAVVNRVDAERRAVEVVSETTDFELRCRGEISSQEYVRRLRALVVKKRRKS